MGGKISKTSSVLPHCCLPHMDVHHQKGVISPLTILRRKEDIALLCAKIVLCSMRLFASPLVLTETNTLIQSMG